MRAPGPGSAPRPRPRLCARPAPVRAPLALGPSARPRVAREGSGGAAGAAGERARRAGARARGRRSGARGEALESAAVPPPGLPPLGAGPRGARSGDRGLEQREPARAAASMADRSLEGMALPWRCAPGWPSWSWSCRKVTGPALGRPRRHGARRAGVPAQGEKRPRPAALRRPAAAPAPGTGGAWGFWGSAEGRARGLGRRASLRAGGAGRAWGLGPQGRPRAGGSGRDAGWGRRWGRRTAAGRGRRRPRAGAACARPGDRAVSLVRVRAPLTAAGPGGVPATRGPEAPRAWF